MSADEARFGGTDYGGKSVKGCFRNAFHALEVPKKSLLGTGAYTPDGGKFAYDGRLGTAVAVVGDAETVRLVAELLHHT